MLLTIAKEIGDGLNGLLKFRMDITMFLAFHADIALSTVVIGLLTKVLEEHTASTSVGGGDITSHLLDALLKISLAVGINNGRQAKKLGIDASHRIADGWGLTMRNEIDDAAMVEILELLIDMVGRHAREMGKEGLLNIDEVGEDAWISTQDGLDEEVGLLIGLVNAVEFFLAQDEMEG